MKPIHPIRTASTLAALLVVVALVGGCRNQQAGLGNPFMAPDHVPPPSTRALAPGTAQPYYPGDPLPIQQSAVQPPGSPTLAAAAAPAAVQPEPTPAPPTQPAAPADAVAAAEPPVAIPDDDYALRPEPTRVVPADDITPIAAASQQSAVVQTSATMPVPTVQPAPLQPAPQQPAPEQVVSDPGVWRAPQIGRTTSTPTVSAPSIASAAGPPIAQTSDVMPVQLRAVPSDRSDVVAPSIPRIRLPGYAPPVQAGVQQASYVAPPVVPGGTVQMVQTVRVAELPPPVAVPAPVSTGPTLASQSDATVLVGRDGFRARSSLR